MTILSQSATAGANGQAVVTITPGKSGIQWAIGQMSVESSQGSQTGQVFIRVNGKLYTSASFLPMAASGQPALLLQGADIMTATFTGLTAGDSGIVNCWYNESLWGTVPKVDVM
jgi:hypothetical protein